MKLFHSLLSLFSIQGFPFQGINVPLRHSTNFRLATNLNSSNSPKKESIPNGLQIKGKSDIKSAASKLSPEAEELETILCKKKGPIKLIVAQTAPSVRVAFSEIYGYEPGAFSSGILVASLKALGFDLVFDTNTAADLTICEEGTELLHHIFLREEANKKAANDLEESTNDSSYKSDDDSKNSTIVNKPLPLFTSCCPGWMNMIAKSNPELISFVSTCKSPHMMFGAMIKSYSQDLLGVDPSQVYMTSIMPCIRKRGESDHDAFIHDGYRDVDNVITTRDLGQLLDLHGIDPTTLEQSRSQTFDSPFQQEEDNDSAPCGLGSGAGQLFGATGGVMEAAVRSVYEILTESQLPRLELNDVRGLGGVKEATIPLYSEETGKGIRGSALKVAVANGLGNAKKLISAMKKHPDYKYDFVEVMACPGGCIGGAGQPRSKNKDVIGKRLDIIYKLDKNLPIRKSHENPTVKAFYERYLKEFGSDVAHKILHVDPVYGDGSSDGDGD